MVAFLTSGGAFLYNIAEEEADRLFSNNYNPYGEKPMIGWLFNTEELFATLELLGIDACYVEKVSDGLDIMECNLLDFKTSYISILAKIKKQPSSKT